MVDKLENIPPVLPANFRAGYVAVLGVPNVGKSTLMNHFLDHKLSIVTRKPQTTRRSVLGILNRPDAQIIFIDTPGILDPQYDLQKMMMRYVDSAIGDADVLLYLLDAAHSKSDGNTLPLLLEKVNKPVILVLNKIDLLDSKTLLPMMADLKDVYPFRAIVPVSALKDSGIAGLSDALVDCLPQSPPYYPTDQVSDQQERFFVAEIVREKIFEQYSDEIPYSTHVQIEEFKERKGNKLYISAVILVEKASQKGILIGKNGVAIKRVGQSARHDIERFLERPVFLNLYVKVAADWRKKESELRKLGY